MADDTEAKVSYPYMTSGQWFGVRTKLRQSVPNVVGVDWLMSALGTSEKGAKNVLPQLKAIGTLSSEGKPIDEVVHDLRDDETYAAACQEIIGRVYPQGLRDSWTDPNEDPEKVAAWFMRNAGTGALTAKMQARFYLLLLSGELPSAEEAAKKAAAATKKTAAKKTPPAAPRSADVKGTEDQKSQERSFAAPDNQQKPPPPASNLLAPNLHIDMQIHISADASDTQIDTIFKSMAKHLYGRE